MGHLFVHEDILHLNTVSKRCSNESKGHLSVNHAQSSYEPGFRSRSLISVRVSLCSLPLAQRLSILPPLYINTISSCKYSNNELEIFSNSS